MLAKMVKVQLLDASCILAAAVIGNLPDNMPLDVNVADPNLQAEDVLTVRLVTIFYPWLLAAMEGSGDAGHPFRDPVLPDPAATPGTVNGLAGILEPLVSKLAGPLGPVVQQLVGPLIQQVLGGLIPKTGTSPAPGASGPAQKLT